MLVLWLVLISRKGCCDVVTIAGAVCRDVGVLQYKERRGLSYQNMMNVGVLIKEMCLGTTAGRDYRVTMYSTSRMVVTECNRPCSWS